MARTLPFTEARAQLSDLLDAVEREREHVVITRSGRPVGVLISVAEYESLEETIEVLSDQELLADLEQSERDVEAGDLTSLDDVLREGA